MSHFSVKIFNVINLIKKGIKIPEKAFTTEIENIKI